MEVSRASFLSDVASIAVQGGINYWADFAEEDVDYPWPQDIHFKVRDAMDSKTEFQAVTDETVENGINAMKNPEFSVRDDIRRSILFADVMHDAGEIDAEAADVIIQAGLFGEIVFG